ncbi:MAG: hypothetical protein Phog2KO_13620 [Phototrophicaceae bacterium]
MSSLDVMLSSTSKDLKKHRKLAEDACNRARFSVNTMDYLSAENDSNAIDVSMRLVEESEVYIGIFGMRYGFRPKDARNPNEISITEMEYRRAKELGMPILIFVMSDEHPSPDTTGKGLKAMREAQADFFESDPRGIEKLDLLKKEVQGNEIVGFFDSAEGLRLKILQSLSSSNLKEAAESYFQKQQKLLADSNNTPETIAPKSDIPYPPELYAFPPYSGQGVNFIGRRRELKILNDWSMPEAKQPMMVVEAIGGMGKSALTWTWLQDRAVTFDGVFWYSFYEGGAEMKTFVRHALAYVTRLTPDSLIKMTLNQMLPKLLHELNTGNYLLVLDGLERVLIAYHRWDAAQMQDDEVEEGKNYRDCTNPQDNDVLKQLANCAPSRILITSRLMPNALTDAGSPLKTVRRVKLGGLSRKDAQELWRKYGITWDDDSVMDGFVSQFGRHSLLLKLLITTIKENRRARGNFSKWYADYGADFNVFKDVKAKRNHILKVAYEGLNETAQKLVSQMAALGNAIDVDTLNVFNPFITIPNVLPEPSLSFDFWMANTEEEKAEIEANHKNSEKYQAYEQSLQAKANYEKSEEYQTGIKKFDALLQDLEARGLIWWDSNTFQYDLHPVVRGYAFSQLNDADKPETFDEIYNYFEAQEQGKYQTRFSSYAEMQNIIAMYNALIGAGKYDAAAELFRDRLRFSLIFEGLGLYHKAYELLLTLFPNGLGKMPIVTAMSLRSSILLFMGSVLSYLGRDDEALVVKGNKILVDLERDNTDSILTALRNFSNSLSELNYLSQSLMARQLSLDISTIINGSQQISYSNYHLININGVLGRWQAMQTAYDNFIQNPPSKDFHIAGQIAYANYLIQEGTERGSIDSLLNSSEELNQKAQDTWNKRGILNIRGDLAMREAEYEQAIDYYNQAAQIGNEQGLRDSDAWGGLARAYARHGNLKQALNIIEDGVVDHHFAESVVYMLNGDVEEATESALKFYKWAWAQGEPYVRRWELEQAQAILKQLGVDEPNLPVWDEANYVPFEHEDKVRALLERLKSEHGEDENKD